MLSAVLSACIERTDTGISGKPLSAGNNNLGWVLAGEFGGVAGEVTNSSDPWEQRFEDGKFILLSGICATGDEVWACDLEVSRIQVFDLDGNHKRNIGLGSPLDGTLPSLVETYNEYREKGVKKADLWETTSGNTWRSRKLDLFKAGDVEVVPGGYYFTDWVKTSLVREPLRDFAVYFVPDDGGLMQVDLGGITFPSYLAVEGAVLAVSDPIGTSLWAAYNTGEGWTAKTLKGGIDFKRYMALETLFSDSKDYPSMLHRFSLSGNGPGEYVYMGGLDIAYEKLVVCDTGNRRLQVIAMIHDKAWRFGTDMLSILGNPAQGKFRFLNPLDISIDADGTMFVLDSGELEVAILDAGFNRIGSFGKGDLVEPYAIDLSDDGKHCYISDRRFNVIHHYATTD